MHLNPTSKVGYLFFKVSEKAFVCIQNDSNDNILDTYYGT